MAALIPGLGNSRIFSPNLRPTSSFGNTQGDNRLGGVGREVQYKERRGGMIQGVVEVCSGASLLQWQCSGLHRQSHKFSLIL